MWWPSLSPDFILLIVRRSCRIKTVSSTARGILFLILNFHMQKRNDSIFLSFYSHPPTFPFIFFSFHFSSFLVSFRLHFLLFLFSFLDSTILVSYLIHFFHSLSFTFTFLSLPIFSPFRIIFFFYFILFCTCLLFVFSCLPPLLSCSDFYCSFPYPFALLLSVYWTAARIFPI